MLEALERNCSATLEDLRKILREELNANVCKSTIRNWLDGELISVKNTRNQIDNMNKDGNKAKRVEYMSQFFQNRAEGRSIVWVDETNFNLYCKRSKGRSRIGTRASVVILASKGANLHCIGAMTTSAVVLFSKRWGSFNPFEPEFRKNSFNPAGKLQLFRSVKLIETHRILKITKKFKLHNIKWIFHWCM